MTAPSRLERATFILVLLLALSGTGAGATPARADFLAGAGRQITTPPLAGTPAGAAADAAFAPAFAMCPQPVFPSAGRFALQEPFDDLDGNGQWDAHVDLTGNPPSGPPEPFCDANANGRWDGIYADNGTGPANGVHDDLDVRAVAISDGTDKPVVYASVDQIGLFDVYTELARADLANTYHVSADLVVSADHNESSPDSIGLYGAGQTPLGVGVRSGIDEYYMSFLADRIAHAAADAVHDLQPAQLYANQVQGPIPSGAGGSSYPLLSGMSQRISDQFPTSVANPTAAPNDDRVAAVDPKMGVLQARTPAGTPIFTVMSLAAHNQEMGNSGPGMSADWPGAVEHALDSTLPGMAMFLVGDNGSEEDPQTNPPVIPNGSENHTNQKTQYIQAQATGERFAQLVAAAARSAQRLGFGPVRLTRKQICVPLENNGFIALAAAGEFGQRQGYACDQSGNPVAPVPNGSITPTASTQFRTFVAYTDVGPDLQMIDIPGEAFPALMLGSPFGVEDESCPRPNPAVPTWHARALFRFQVGLADDLLGYLIPAWGFASGTPGLFNNDTCYQDQAGHRHKLESESVGPTGANDVANSLAGLLDAEKDPSAHIVTGRFVLADGSYSRWPTGAAAIQIPAAGASALDPGAGTIIGGPRTAGFGGRAVDTTGLFMDYDGQPQAQPDITTRGMMVFDSRGCVAARYYLNVFPTLTSTAGLGSVRGQPAITPQGPCPAGNDLGGVAQVQAGAAAAAGLAAPLGASGAAGPAGGSGAAGALCASRRPLTTIARRGGQGTLRARARSGRLRLHGGARAFACSGRPGRIARVTVSLLARNVRRDPSHCRFLLASGRLTGRRPCSQPVQLLAHGGTAWSLALNLRIPRGRYTVIVRAVDTHGLAEAGGSHADLTRLVAR